MPTSKLYALKFARTLLSVSAMAVMMGCEHIEYGTQEETLPSLQQYQTNEGLDNIDTMKVASNIHETPSDEDPIQFKKGETTGEDPLEDFNRTMFVFNEIVDGLFLKPAAQIYELCVHEDVRDGVHNVLQNLGSPLIFVNDVLQGSPQKAGETLTRFVLNSTFGLAGYFDVASEVVNIDYHFEDFGQTLAVWGADSGPYVMVPLLGPSNPRDIIGRIADWFMDPLSIALRRADRRNLTYVRLGADYIDRRSRSFEIEKTIYSSDDPYNMMKTLYVQNRQFHINNGLVDQDSPVPIDDEE